ncbi:MAG: LTA synthase family protein [Clostridia bacterium]|nr:LTA synthase family protein [Clostridia bacterium]
MSKLEKIKQIIKGDAAAQRSLRRALPMFYFFTACVAYWEVLMHVAMFESISWRILYVLAFTVFWGAFATFLCGFGKERTGKIILWVTQSVMCLWYMCQTIYYRVFGGFISLYLVKMGGTAITNFFKETVECILRNLWFLALLALPLVATAFLQKKGFFALKRRGGKIQGRMAIICALIHLVCLLLLPIGGTQPYSVYDLYHSPNTGTDASVTNLGFLTTARLELKFMILGAGRTGDIGDLLVPDLPDSSGGEEGGSNIPGGDLNPGDDPTPTYEDQVLEIDFDKLISDAQAKGDETLATLHKYFASVKPTKTNEYTGKFKGKNLIYMVCESFSPEVISQEMTPTLYKLYNNGIKFNNFYGTFRNVTTNGEYAACMGIFPDMSRAKKDGSFAKSADNYMPFALGNIFKNQLGIQSNGYHNYVGSYYDRKYSHPNMGYDCKFMNAGMKFSYSWPSSDLEMMEQSVADYVNKDQFHAYYMTFSGHYTYSFAYNENEKTWQNPMCHINEDAVKHLQFTDKESTNTKLQAYVACHLELEKAMAFLLEQLEQAGQLENTVIVMTTDHYPYGLTAKEYAPLIGREYNDDLADFGIYENAFICWDGGMQESIEIDTPCCTVDILPTLLNLFGFEYDSRLLAGKDVLDPDARHVAILHNGSFITEEVKFNSKTGETTYLVPEDQVAEDYVDTMNRLVANEFTSSTAILNYDYYRIVLGDQAGSPALDPAA